MSSGMVDNFHLPAQATQWSSYIQVLFIAIHLLGLACFAYIVAKRLAPVLNAERDLRFDRPLVRLRNVLQFWLGQWRHPRYRFAGTVHILIFSGFIILAFRAFSTVIFGLNDFGVPESAAALSRLYAVVTEYATTIVFVAMVIAIVRRIVFKPARYAVPPRFGKWRAVDAIFLLVLIAMLMLADSIFEGARSAAQLHFGYASESLAVLSLPWAVQKTLLSSSLPALRSVYLAGYFAHLLTFYFLLCYRPFGIQFHVETSLFSIFFAKLDRGTLKPVRWGVSDKDLDQVKSFGVKKFEDFTWKHVLDFYSCADCGRCSDNCPSNTVGRPLSPRFITFKAREYCFEHYPVFTAAAKDGQPLIGSVYSEDEIWSCTTCGACEQECPLFVEYIDKIVDMRRGLVDDGNVPQSLQKPLKSLESRGNPYGKMEKKRAEWAKAKDFQQTCSVKVLDGKNDATTLYFVDSITSYDDRIQAIGRATARILDHVGENFGILGAAEKDSGHEVRRFGEETLFMALREQNVEAIKDTGVKRIVTADPHAYNALKHDYRDMPPVEHISELIARKVSTGKIRFKPVDNEATIYAYHDPCYLGRHNQIYDEPRDVLDAIPGLKRVEMNRCRDRSFCCGGGGLMLFYEPKEDQRMGVVRVRMAAEAGANVIVTACPFCMVNIEDAIKVAGMEGKMTAIDLTELVDRHIDRDARNHTAARQEVVTANQGG
jgi:Fe-S oxidoreductase